MTDIVRVLRIIEYTGPRQMVKDQIANSLQNGEKRIGSMTIRIATVGGYPEVLGRSGDCEHD